MLFLAGLLLLAPPAVVAQCFFRNGELAIIGDQSYVQCPGVDFCCLPTDSCGSNGLCVDVNNHGDGSLTGNFNFTGLYQTPACANTEWTGCETQCSSSQSSDRAYIWSCNDQKTEYCCLGANALDTQGSCCSPSTNFEIDAAATTTSTRSMTSMSSTSSTASVSEATASTISSITASATPSPDSGLSSGAKIGIGVGVAGAVLALAALVGIMLCLRRRRTPKDGEPATAASYQPVTTEVPRRYEQDHSMAKTEAAYTDWPVESKRVDSPPAEMDAGRYGAVEMAGDTDYSRKHTGSELA